MDPISLMMAFLKAGGGQAAAGAAGGAAGAANPMAALMQSLGATRGTQPQAKKHTGIRAANPTGIAPPQITPGKDAPKKKQDPLAALMGLLDMFGGVSGGAHSFGGASAHTPGTGADSPSGIPSADYAQLWRRR